MIPSAQQPAAAAPLPDYVPREQYEELRRDFVEFTYIVSHDFQAPLRHIRGFSKLLMTHLEDKVEGKEKGYVQIVNDSIDRCEKMMAGLLDYSRLNTRGNPFADADLNILIEQAVAELRRSQAMDGVKIQVEPLPHAWGDAAQLKQLFSHLIDNAVKFRRPKQPPHIRIHARPQDGGHEFYVEDNGIGLPPEYETQVYTLFRKLDPSTQGVGVGLTLCRKIVAKHGGTLGYEYGEGGGTTFVVFLPSAPRWTSSEHLR